MILGSNITYLDACHPMVLVETVKEILGKVPVFGICMGHQLLGQALGGTTFKMMFGHHGGNHPVRNLQSGHVEISAQVC